MTSREHNQVKPPRLSIIYLKLSETAHLLSVSPSPLTRLGKDTFTRHPISFGKMKNSFLQEQRQKSKFVSGTLFPFSGKSCESSSSFGQIFSRGRCPEFCFFGIPICNLNQWLPTTSNNGTNRIISFAFHHHIRAAINKKNHSKLKILTIVTVKLRLQPSLPWKGARAEDSSGQEHHFQ